MILTLICLEMKIFRKKNTINSDPSKGIHVLFLCVPGAWYLLSLLLGTLAHPLEPGDPNENEHVSCPKKEPFPKEMNHLGGGFKKKLGQRFNH